MTVRLAALVRHGALAMILLLAAVSRPARPARAASLCVNPGGTGGCYGLIADALAAAGDGDTIRVAGGAPYLERLAITKSISLIGADPATTILDGSAAGEVIRITTSITVTLANLTLRNGQGPAGSADADTGGGIHNQFGRLTLNNVIVTGNQSGADASGGANGGGIANNQGVLTLVNSLVFNNATASPPDNASGQGAPAGYGGGIFNANGALILDHSTVRDNTTGHGGNGTSGGGQGGSGGGVYSAAGSVLLRSSTIRDNTTGDGGSGGAGGSAGNGGGLGSNHPLITILNSSLTGNQTGQGAGPNGSSGSGAGLYLTEGDFPRGASVISNSTLSGNATGLGLLGNTGGNGGGLFVQGVPLRMVNDTVAFNDVDSDQSGAGLASDGAVISLTNSLLAHNIAGNNIDSVHDCAGSITSLGYNLIMEPDNTCAAAATTGDQFFVGGQIVAPLANNGGPTATNALPPGSPAIDAANTSACPATDQRGLPRPAFGGIELRCDIGAFELYRFSLGLPLVIK